MSSTVANALLVLFVLLLGAFFAGSEIALVSLREGQVRALSQRGRRGQRVAALHADPNRFLAAVQIGVTLAGFMSAAFGASAFADDLSPILRDWGLPGGPDGDPQAQDTAYWVAFVVVTLVITYLSLAQRHQRDLGRHEDALDEDQEQDDPDVEQRCAGHPASLGSYALAARGARRRTGASAGGASGATVAAGALPRSSTFATKDGSSVIGTCPTPRIMMCSPSGNIRRAASACHGGRTRSRAAHAMVTGTSSGISMSNGLAADSSVRSAGRA